jgi:hypothetical protein
MRPFRSLPQALGLPGLGLAALLAGGGSLLAVCGPFTDVTDPTFCSSVLEIFTLGVTTGTTATTYDPTSAVSRLQMAIFLSREADRVLLRGSRRAALGQFWIPQDGRALRVTTIAFQPRFVRSDGTDLWLTSNGGTVSRIRGSDGKLLETWTGASQANGVLVAAGRIFVAGNDDPGNLYRIDPRLAAGAVTTVATNLGGFPGGIAYDGSRIWTANGGGSVSIVTPGASLPWTATTVTAGFTDPVGIFHDGANVWVTDDFAGKLLKLDASGAILQTVTLGTPSVAYPAFDGTNIWVPGESANKVSVVRSSTGTLLATLTGNGLNIPTSAAFDGQRILVTDSNGDGVSLWRAADLTPLGFFGTGASTSPSFACSDGVNFWITLVVQNQLARF